MTYIVEALKHHEDPENSVLFEDINEAVALAKQTLGKKIARHVNWEWDSMQAFIANVEVRDIRIDEIDVLDPLYKSLFDKEYSIWDDEFSQEMCIHHVSDLHHVLFSNYYEDGRNEPLAYIMKDGIFRMFLDVCWLDFSHECSSQEAYVLVKTAALEYNWDHGMPDLDEAIVYIYNSKDPELTTMLKEIRTQIA